MRSSGSLSASANKEMALLLRNNASVRSSGLRDVGIAKSFFCPGNFCERRDPSLLICSLVSNEKFYQWTAEGDFLRMILGHHY